MNHLCSISLLAILLATGCSGSTVKETLGIGSSAPDEFRVVSRPPLSVPPQFNLRPPSVGDASANPYATDKQAQSLITGAAPEPAPGSETFTLHGGNADTAVQPVTLTGTSRIEGTSSSAESQFLQNAGAASADPSVRRELIEEKLIRQEAKEEKGWWDFWDTDTDKKETMVNAGKEAERIKQNQDEGKPVNEGETPVVKTRDRGVLGRILGD